MARNFSISAILTATDRFSGPLRQAGQNLFSFAHAAQSQFSIIQNAQNRTGQSTQNLWRKFNTHNAIGHIKDLGSALKQLASTAGSVFSTLKPGFGTLAGIATAGYGLSKVVGFASEHEDAVLSLSTMYGGKKQGQDRAKFLEQMAAKLPYEFADYLAADVVMKDVGKTATADEFKGLASIASAKGINFGDFVRDMRGMDTEGLKTILGAGALPESKDGVLSINDLNGKRISFNKDVEGIAKFYTYLGKFGNKKYAGLAEERGNTFSGLVATMSDTIKQGFAATFTESGLYDDVVKPFIRGITEGMEQNTPALGNIFKGFYDNLAKTGLLSSIGNSIKSTIGVLTNSFGQLLNSLAKNDTGFINGIKNFFDKLPERAQSFMDSLKSTDWSSVSSSISSISSSIVDLTSAVINFLPSLTSLLNTLAHPTSAIGTAIAPDQNEQGFFGRIWERSKSRMAAKVIGAVMPGVDGDELTSEALKDRRVISTPTLNSLPLNLGIPQMIPPTEKPTQFNQTINVSREGFVDVQTSSPTGAALKQNLKTGTMRRSN